jgi:hypothetical protein
LRIERIPLGDLHKILQTATRDPTSRHLAAGRIEIQTEEASSYFHAAQHPSEQQSRVPGARPELHDSAGAASHYQAVQK